MQNGLLLSHLVPPLHNPQVTAHRKCHGSFTWYPGYHRGLDHTSQTCTLHFFTFWGLKVFQLWTKQCLLKVSLHTLGVFFVCLIFFNSHSAAEIGLSAPPFTLGLTKINHKNGTISPTDVGRRRRFQPWSLLDFVWLCATQGRLPYTRSSFSSADRREKTGLQVWTPTNLQGTTDTH